MPGLKKYGDIIDDYQLAIAGKFEQFGYLFVAYEPKEMPAENEKLKSFVPQCR